MMCVPPPYPNVSCSLADGLYCGADSAEAAYRLALSNLTGLPPSPW
jgi:hypothetical protein